jgi:hypothetical protein
MTSNEPCPLFGPDVPETTEMEPLLPACSPVVHPVKSPVSNPPLVINSVVSAKDGVANVRSPRETDNRQICCWLGFAIDPIGTIGI